MIIQELNYETEVLKVSPELNSDSVVQRFVHPVSPDFDVFFSQLICGTMYVFIRVLSAVIKGTTYRKGTVVVCGIEDDAPLFGSITELIVTPHQECLFVISPLLKLAYQYHYHAYEVVPTSLTVVYHHGQLFDYHTLVCTRVVGRSCLFVCTKYNLFS